MNTRKPYPYPFDHQFGSSDPMHREWEAWRQVCRQLSRLGVDINKQSPLCRAICLWGEELVALRDTQDNLVRTRAHEEACQLYRLDYLPEKL